MKARRALVIQFRPDSRSKPAGSLEAESARGGLQLRRLASQDEKQFKAAIGYEDREDDVLQTQLFKAGEDEQIAALAAQWRAAFDGRGFKELAIVEGR